MRRGHFSGLWQTSSSRPGVERNSPETLELAGMDTGSWTRFSSSPTNGHLEKSRRVIHHSLVYIVAAQRIKHPSWGCWGGGCAQPLLSSPLSSLLSKYPPIHARLLHFSGIHQAAPGFHSEAFLPIGALLCRRRRRCSLFQFLPDACSPEQTKWFFIGSRRLSLW
jgi:hypothetical protein